MLSVGKKHSGSWLVRRGGTLNLDQPRIMGVLNITPDSFSDGGRFCDPDVALLHALAMVEDGAAIIDIGGESTRPGANRVSAREQIERVVPVVKRIRAQSDVLISVDTTLCEVAAAMLDAGTDIINDVSAGLEDNAILALVAERRCGLILMHRLRNPEQDSFSDQYQIQPEYENVLETVRTFLSDRISDAMNAGVQMEQIVIDPGLGFGKTVNQNFDLVASIAGLENLGCPVLSAASRKSFVGSVSGVTKPEHRVSGSVAITVAHALSGIRLFRVHDVKAHREALDVAVAIINASEKSESEMETGKP